MTDRRSLASEHPGCWHVPVGTLAATGLLVAGLLLPVMRVRTLGFWKDDYTILSGAASLWRDGHRVLACVLVGFSVVLPAAKLALLLGAWFVPMRRGGRSRALAWMDAIGRWSMLDVFVVAVTIVLLSARSSLDATPRAGLYVFAGAVVASMVLTREVERRSRRAAGPPVPTDRAPPRPR